MVIHLETIFISKTVQWINSEYSHGDTVPNRSVLGVIVPILNAGYIVTEGHSRSPQSHQTHYVRTGSRTQYPRAVWVL